MLMVPFPVSSEQVTLPEASAVRAPPPRKPVQSAVAMVRPPVLILTPPPKVFVAEFV